MQKPFVMALLLTLLMSLLALTACGGSEDKPEADGTTDKAGLTASSPKEAAVTITETAAKSVELELHKNADFSLQIPASWKVTSGGVGMCHSIRIQDPTEPLNQIFVLLKADFLLHSQEGKDGWSYYSNFADASAAQIFANAVVLPNPSTEGFYQILPQYADFATQVEASYAGYTFPRFKGFTVTERFPSTSLLSGSALNDELLRATFTEDGREGEGMFAASVVDFGSVPIAAGPPVGYQIPQTDGGYYMAYNVMAVTAAKDTLIEWEDVLTKCLGTLEYSDSFVNSTIQAGQETVQQALDFSRNANAVLDGIMSSWDARNTSQDIMSQKQSDATLGYERVCDTETGEIYRAENGWSDSYQGSRYQPVTEDQMFVQPISGYIE